MQYQRPNGQWATVSERCLCGGADCQRCFPGNNYQLDEQVARGETYCLTCETHHLSEFNDETLCDNCGKEFGYLLGIFPKDDGFHRIQWATHDATEAPSKEGALKAFLDEMDIAYDEDSFDARASEFWVLKMEGHPDWLDWNECTPPEDYMPLLLEPAPWLEKSQ